MTRIADVSLLRMLLRFREPVRYAGAWLSTQQVAVLRLATDDGVVGHGEVTRATLPGDVEADVVRARHQLLGTDPSDIGEIDGPLGAAVDTAVLDVLGRIGGHSVATLLGGGVESVGVNALLIVSGTPDQDAAAACALVDAGYLTLKLKPTVTGSLIGTSLRAIRDAVGPGIALRLDLNGQLAEADAIKRLMTLESIGLEYVEQPVAPSLGTAALTRVRGSIPMPLAADESVTDLAAACALLDARACDVLVVKPSRVGGPRASVRIARAAAAAGVAVTISTMYESGIGLATALQVAATLPGGRAHGLGTLALLESDLIGGSLQIVDGRMSLPLGAGLGVTLDPAANLPQPARP
ncbi:MAG: mandelate racemase/muconate lactonizing enzyme family protein [Chloroflexi bacterium]|nr:mandelate racemase/muconate lactonizing enzyme family protein [Chloroflexota bacterium]